MEPTGADDTNIPSTSNLSIRIGGDIYPHQASERNSQPKKSQPSMDDSQPRRDEHAKDSANTPPMRSKATSGKAPKKMKIMIAGDSISHGVEGDHTWRYRLWQWLQSSAQSTTFEFVGPYIGTVPPEQPNPPKPPRFADEKEPPERDLTTGGYALDVSKHFQSRHFAYSGRQIFQAKDTIASQIRLYQPDLLLVMLGFNDLGWCVSGPEGTLENMMKFIYAARSAKPDLDFAVANVLQRSPLSGHPSLPAWTSKYNSMLQNAIHEENKKSVRDRLVASELSETTDRLQLSRDSVQSGREEEHTNQSILSPLPLRAEAKPSSRIELVEIERNYGMVPDDCAGTCDGLHPNSLGEYQIARAFSLTLHQSFSIGTSTLQIPSNIPQRPAPIPSNVRATGVPYGIRFSFDAVYGARGYDIRQRSGGEEGTWTETQQSSNQIDNSFTGAGVLWSFQVRTRGGEHESEKSPWSEIVSAYAHRETAPAPRSSAVWATSTGFEATWEPLHGSKWEVERYAVLWQDKTVAGFLCAQGAHGNSARVEGLDSGHRYEVWLQTWTSKEGPGVPESVCVLVVGSGVFSRPQTH